MAAEIGAFRILLPSGGPGIVLGHDLLPVRIEHPVILVMGIAGITDREMGAGLFRDQDREQGLDVISAGRREGGRIGPDRALSHGKGRIMKENIVFYIFPAFGRIREVAAGIRFRHTFFKADGQICILQAFQVDFGDMEQAVRSLQDRAGKDLPDRNIDVGHAVLKDCLTVRILQLPQFDSQVCPVGIPPLYADMVSVIQGIDQGSLDPAVFHVIQGVDLHDRVKDLFIAVRRDRRKRKRDHGKAALPSPDGFLLQGGGFAPVFGHFLPLTAVQDRHAGVPDRGEGRLAEGLHHSGSREKDCLRMELLIGGLQGFQPAVAHKAVQEKGNILPVIIAALGIGDRPPIARMISPGQTEEGLHGPGRRAGQSHPVKILQSPAHHALKAEMIDDAVLLFDRQILAGDLKTDPVAFRIGVRHAGDLFRGHGIQVPGGPQFVFCDIFSVPVQIAEVGQIRLPYDPFGDTGAAHQLLADLTEGLRLRVIRQEIIDPVPDMEMVRDLVSVRIRLGFREAGGEHMIDLQKEFHTDQHPFRFIFEYEGNHSPELIIQGTEEFSVPAAHPVFRVSVTGITVLIMTGQDLFI